MSHNNFFMGLYWPTCLDFYTCYLQRRKLFPIDIGHTKPTLFET